MQVSCSFLPGHSFFYCCASLLLALLLLQFTLACSKGRPTCLFLHVLSVYIFTHWGGPPPSLALFTSRSLCCFTINTFVEVEAAFTGNVSTDKSNRHAIPHNAHVTQVQSGTVTMCLRMSISHTQRAHGSLSTAVFGRMSKLPAIPTLPWLLDIMENRKMPASQPNIRRYVMALKCRFGY